MNDSPLTFPSPQELRNIRRRAEEMRVQFLKDLAARVISRLSGPTSRRA